jgi:hypothetical protein
LVCGLSLLLLAREDNTFELLLEPLDGFSLLDVVGGTDGSTSALALGDAFTAAAEDDVEVHTVDTSGGIVLDTEVDVLVDTEAERTSVGEVVGAEFVLLDLEALVEEVHGLLAANGAVGGNLFVTADTEGADGDAGAGEDGALVAELLEDLGGTSQAITRFTSGAVDAELLDEDLAHRIVLLFGSSDHFFWRESKIKNFSNSKMEKGFV